MHWGSSRVICHPPEDHSGATLPGNRFDHSQRQIQSFQHRPLLNMELKISNYTFSHLGIGKESGI
jgi:hypothetical protein